MKLMKHKILIEKEKNRTNLNQKSNFESYIYVKFSYWWPSIGGYFLLVAVQSTGMSIQSPA